MEDARVVAATVDVKVSYLQLFRDIDVDVVDRSNGTTCKGRTVDDVPQNAGEQTWYSYHQCLCFFAMAVPHGFRTVSFRSTDDPEEYRGVCGPDP